MPTPEQVDFFGIMGQVGITAFALMFAAAQFSREEWLRNVFQHSKVSGSLYQLL